MTTSAESLVRRNANKDDLRIPGWVTLAASFGIFCALTIVLSILVMAGLLYLYYLG